MKSYEEIICPQCNGTGESNICEECGSCSYCGGSGLLKQAGMSAKKYRQLERRKQQYYGDLHDA